VGAHLVAALLALAGCASQADDTSRAADRLKLITEAAFYYRCEHQPVVVAAECLSWLRAYDRDLAAFEVKYPSGK
jgi:hypothetical protein